MPLTVAVRIELPALAHGEVRSLALRHMSFGSRQRGADQRTMDGPVVAFVAGALLFGLGAFGIAFRLGRGRCRKFGLLCWFVARLRALVCRISSVERRALVGRLEFVFVSLDSVRQLGCAFDELGRRDTCLAASGCGHFGLLVFVIRVAGRAPRLLDGVFDQRDHHMVGNAALARTVVVYNVTEPKPALLHTNSPEPIPSGGRLFQFETVR